MAPFRASAGSTQDWKHFDFDIDDGVPTVTFAFLFTRVGLAGADMGCAYLLPRVVGLGRASELLLLGDRIDADRAVQIGLATRVVDDDVFRANVVELARELADGPSLAYGS